MGRPSAQSRSIQSANPSSQLLRRRQINSRWLHEQGDNHLDARRSLADLIVLAGNAAVEAAAKQAGEAVTVPFTDRKSVV